MEVSVRTNDPTALRDEIVRWLRSQQKRHHEQAIKRITKKARDRDLSMSDAYKVAADFWADVKIGPEA